MSESRGKTDIDAIKRDMARDAELQSANVIIPHAVTEDLTLAELGRRHAAEINLRIIKKIREGCDRPHP